MRTGMLLGLWWGLWLAAALLCSWFGWGVVTGDYNVARIMVMAFEMRWAWAPGLATLLVVCVLVPVLAGAIAGGLAGALSRWFRVDPKQHSLGALRWTWVATRRLAWVLLLPPLVLAGLEMGDVESWVGALTLIPVFMVLPFLVSDRPLLAGDAERWRLRWRWPGTGPLVGILLLLVLGGVLELVAVESFKYTTSQASSMLWWLLIPVIGTGAWLVGAWFNAASDGLWIDGAGASGGAGIRRILRRALDRHRIEAYVAMDVRICVLVAILAPLHVLPAVLSIYEFPQVQFQLADLGQPVPGLLRALFWLGSSNAMFLMMLPLAVPLVLAYRRLWVALDPDAAT